MYYHSLNCWRICRSSLCINSRESRCSNRTKYCNSKTRSRSNIFKGIHNWGIWNIPFCFSNFKCEISLKKVNKHSRMLRCRNGTFWSIKYGGRSIRRMYQPSCWNCSMHFPILCLKFIQGCSKRRVFSILVLLCLRNCHRRYLGRMLLKTKWLFNKNNGIISKIR